jgi:hypothetical protein
MLSVVMLSVILSVVMLSDIMLSVVMLSDIMLSVVMLSVVTPFSRHLISINKIISSFLPNLKIRGRIHHTLFSL